MSEHLTYLREVLDNDAIGFGEDFQFQDAVEHLEALEHASEQYRKVMTEQAKRIEQLETENERLLANIKTDNMWFRAYHKWCEMNGCAPSSSDLSAARAALEASDD